MCVSCLRCEVDISEGISKQLSIQWCKGCGRYHEPPNRWLKCGLESKELLMFCLRRVKNLNKVRLVDASFVYTEPHSKRLKVKLQCQKQVYQSMIFEQTFVIEYLVSSLFCPECHRYEAGGDENMWTAVVQARQRVAHKRTFLWLEQVILRHAAHSYISSVKVIRDGLDFYFSSLTHAKHFVDFLHAFVPARSSLNKKLVTHDCKSNTYQYKWSIPVELVPVCKEDLVYLSTKQRRNFGGMSPWLLVAKISNVIHLMDPSTLVTREVQPSQFWAQPLHVFATKAQLTEFLVLDVEFASAPLPSSSRNHQLCYVTVARMSDLGRSDAQFQVLSHLGRWIRAGQKVLGYDLETINRASEVPEYSKRRRGNERADEDRPDVILVKRCPSARRGKRNWKLKSLAKEFEVERNMNASDYEKEQEDYEQFLQELEEDAEARKNVCLYKKTGGEARSNAPQKMEVSDAETMEACEHTSEEDGEKWPEIGLDELLDDFDSLDVEEK